MTLKSDEDLVDLALEILSEILLLVIGYEPGIVLLEILDELLVLLLPLIPWLETIELRSAVTELKSCFC